MKHYSFRTVREYIITLKKPKYKDGVKIETEIKEKYTYYGIISPFVEDYIIMSTTDKKEAILHTKKELNKVSYLLKRKGIKDFVIFELSDDKKDQPINISLYEI